MSTEPIADHHNRFQQTYGDSSLARWYFHDDPDPGVRYVRDRRLRIALERLEQIVGRPAETMTALVVCAGVGGEASYLRRRGLDCTASDFSEAALELCARRDPELRTVQADAMRLDSFAAGEFDVVVVQDGLHHLPNPVQGYTEMLRVAGLAVIVIEPHEGVVGRKLGREWEVEPEGINFVFRWDKSLYIRATKSYLVQAPHVAEPLRLWDYNQAFGRMQSRVGSAAAKRIMQVAYFVLNAVGPIRRQGNMMVGITVKGEYKPGRVRRRLFR